MSSIDPFLGTWLLTSCEHILEDGTSFFPLGPQPLGTLLYSSDGYMSGTLMKRERTRFSTSDLFGGTEAERAQAMASYVHYSGKYELKEPWMIHHVEVSLFPNWVGTRQQRLYRFENNNLILSTRLFAVAGVKQTAHLVWRRP